jgi:threonine dehydratase
MCPKEKPLHIVTPLLRSAALTELLPGCEGVYLKMENCQIAGSFKIRGFGRLAQKVRCLTLILWKYVAYKQI